MNVGPNPDTIERLRRVNNLMRTQGMSQMAACKRVKVSRTYHSLFPRKYPHLVKDAGYAVNAD